MALIASLEEGRLQNIKLHEAIPAIYFCHEVDGRKLFQINTMGRKTRDIPGKVSQSIQLDQDTAKQLVEILTRHFGL